MLERLFWKLAAKWAAAKQNPEAGELTSRTRPAPRGHEVEHGWWLLPEQWGLGVAVERVDWLPAGHHGHLTLLVHLGPFCWGADLMQPSPSAVTR